MTRMGSDVSWRRTIARLLVIPGRENELGNKFRVESVLWQDCLDDAPNGHVLSEHAE